MSRKGDFEYVLDEMLAIDDSLATPFVKAVGSFMLEELELELIGVELGMDVSLETVYTDDSDEPIVLGLIAKSKLGKEAFRIVERRVHDDLMQGDLRLGAWTIFETLQKMAMSDSYRYSTLLKVVRLISLFTMSGLELADVHVLTFKSSIDRIHWTMATETHTYLFRIELNVMQAESVAKCVNNYLPPPEGAEQC